MLTAPLPLLLTCAVVLGALQLHGQQFEEVHDTLKGADSGSAAWCDFNNDGMLDFFVTGHNLNGNDFEHAVFYRGEGNNHFTEGNIDAITRVIYSNQALGDFDNDGDIDVFLCGTTSGFHEDNIAELYENVGGSAFVRTHHYFDKIRGHVEWVDFDNDGDLDLFLLGTDNQDIFRGMLYVNNDDNTFTGSTIRSYSEEEPHSICAAWADFNNDGYKDLFINHRGEKYTTTLYRNDYTGTLQPMVALNIPFRDYKSAVTGDYNSDGYIDLLLWVYENYTPSKMDVVLFENQGDFQFREVWRRNVQHFGGSMQLTDLNYDGRTDIVVYCENEGPTKLFINENNNGTFTEKNIYNLPATVWFGELYLADSDKDYDLDALAIGTLTGSAADGYTRIYQNTDTPKNTPPDPPDSISVDYFSNNMICIKWTDGYDAQTPSPGLSYNISVGTASNKSQILSNHTNADNSRQLVDYGNTKNKFYFLKGLPPGDYVCTVQTIDNSYCASESVSSFAFAISANVQESSISIYPNPGRGVLHFSNYYQSRDVRIYDAIGKQILAVKQHPPITPLDISYLPTGVYLVEFKKYASLERQLVKVVKF
jgi:hypothetical protein